VFDHVMIRASDRDASERFYDTVLSPIGIDKTYSDASFASWGSFALAAADAEVPVTRNLHIGFVAAGRAEVDEFWRTGTAAGYRSDGEPGPRPQYGPDYYGSFVLDPDGNSAEAVHHDGVSTRGMIDHLWIRVADVAAAKRFYETIAPHAGLRLGADTPERVQFQGESGSFLLVAGTPAEHVHVAFAAGDAGAVHAFHEAATAAGYRDNGGPGERPAYGAGYHAAFVLDPDGNNVEVVHHAAG
jgi:catechol 2,3-dioxygenase-like lactoylglutathione lyase family enzyme